MDAKQVLVDHLYELPGQVLGLLWNAVRYPSLKAAGRAVIGLLTTTEQLGLAGLTEIFREAMPKLEEIVAIQIQMAEHSIWKEGRALAVPSVILLAAGLDALGMGGNQGDVRIFHDETATFEPVLLEAFRQIRDAPKAVIPLPTGLEARLGYQSLTTYFPLPHGRV